MDERQLAQIALVIAHELDLARRSAEDQIRAVYANHAAKGVLGSGATVKAVSATIGLVSEQLLVTLADKVGAIAKVPPAHDQIVAAMEQHLANMEAAVINSAKIASRSGSNPPIPSVLQGAMTLFDQVKADIRTKVEIERFNFTEVGQPDLTAPPVNSELPQTPKNRGGKPLAEHWDAMWAHIAVKLWTGDLQPKSQAEIKAAMFDWFNKESITIGDTGVTNRARQLWRAWEAAQ